MRLSEVSDLVSSVGGGVEKDLVGKWTWLGLLSLLAFFSWVIVNVNKIRTLAKQLSLRDTVRPTCI